MSRASRWAIALLTIGLAAGAGYRFVYLPITQEEPVTEIADAAVVDAAVDARAPVAKGKPGKKPAVRGGKTRVTGKSGGTKPAAPVPPVAHGSKPAPGLPPQEKPEKHEKHDRHEKAPSGPSYESALDGNDDQVTIGAKGQADLTDAQLSGPMSDGAVRGECDPPETTGVTVQVAIKGGHAVGVSVETSPPSMHLNACIDRHVRMLSWPSSPKLDSLVTTY